MDTHDRTASVKPAQEEISSIDDVAKPLDSFGRIVFFVVLIEVLMMVGLNLYQNSRLNSLTKVLQAKQVELNSEPYRLLNNQVEEVLTGNEQLKIIFDSKIDWTKFYGQLNAITPKNVRLSSISIAESGSFKADGETASLSSLSQALVAWQKGTESIQSPFSSVVLNNNGFTSDGGARRVTFSVTGQVDTGRFR